MRQPILRLLALLALAVVFLPAGAARAQSDGLFIDIQPESGPPGTTVTISGRGAPPGQLVRVLFAPFDNLGDCRTGRDAALVAEIRANADGSFLATHLARATGDRQAGNTYLADLGGAVGQPRSDLECFQFRAAQGGRFFPETGYSVGGRFLEYWVNNGGLYVFGYPLTNELAEDGRTVQYFERARFEFWPENQPPYDVQLGRIGVEILARSGVDWQVQPTSPGPAPGCLYFEITRHNVCNQQRGIGFLNTWSSNGLSFDGRSGVSYAESLALLGYPITEPYSYTFADGRVLQVQWFERARMEWHPDNPSAYRVLLGRLGAELLEARTP